MTAKRKDGKTASNRTTKQKEPAKKRRTRSLKPNLEDWIILCEKYGGIVLDIAKAMKVTSKTVHNWINSDEEFEKELESSREVFFDLSLKGLKYHLEKKSEKSILWSLDRLGRNRGFGQKIQIESVNELDKQLEGLTEEELLARYNSINSKINNG